LKNTVSKVYFCSIMDKHEFRFKVIAQIEGWSFMILLLIAMPLKYVAHLPLPVKIVGWMHGVLFVLYGFFLLMVLIKSGWKFSRVLLAMLVSFIPLGTFWFERKYLDERFCN
jgi:integral membrane protein